MLGLVLALPGLLYYSTVKREAVSRVGKSAAAHARDSFQCSGALLSNKQSTSVVFKSSGLK